MIDIEKIKNRLKQYEPLWGNWKSTGEVLGAGGSGCVIRLQRNELGIKSNSVVKVIQIDNNLRNYETVKSEIETMCNIHSDYLVPCLNYRVEAITATNGTIIGYDFLIHMNEYVSLSDYLKDYEGDFMEFFPKLAYEIGMALIDLHQNDIIHRDIKPDNIFIDSNTTRTKFLLGDFGISKKIRDLSGLTSAGTTDYMAPESIRFFDYSVRSDIYSYGMMLYYILNDCNFPNTSQIGLDNPCTLLTDQPLPPPCFGDERQKRVVLKCCAKDPANRYPSALAVMNAFFETNERQQTNKVHNQKEVAPTATGRSIYDSQTINSEAPYPYAQTTQTSYSKKPFKKPIAIIAVISIVVLASIAVALFVLRPSLSDSPSASSKAPSTSEKKADSQAASDIFNQAESFYASKEYVEAINEYRKIDEDDPNYGAAQQRITDAKRELSQYVDGILLESDELFDQKDYKNALDKLDEIKDANEADEILDNKISQKRTVYLKGYEDHLSYMIDNGEDWDATDKELKEASSCFHRNNADDRYNTLRTALDDKKPILLTDLKKYEVNGRFYDLCIEEYPESVTDYNNIFYNTSENKISKLYVYAGFNQGNATFPLANTGIKRFKGILVAGNDKHDSANGTVEIKVGNDTKNMKTIKSISWSRGSGEASQTFDVDISGYNYMEINYHSNDLDNDDFYMVNAELNK